MKFLKQSWVTYILLIAILIAVLVNIAITLDVNEKSDKSNDAMQGIDKEEQDHGWWFFGDKEKADVEDDVKGVDNNSLSENYNPVINPGNFVDKIDNKYYSLAPGIQFIIKGTKGDENQTNNVFVTTSTKTIMGVKTIVVNDRVLDKNGDLIEETFDWYAQDKEGNVWYFGEDAKDYENGKVVSTEGSWEAGVNGALPGIIMKANPALGETWRQEYLKGVAEDMAQVLSLNESITVASGSYKNCIKTKDWSALIPDVIENKYYCPNGGVVLAEAVQGEQEHMELTQIK